MLAILVALVFLFPLYWAASTSLRTPLETFTIAGFGIPWINFTPTLDNWADQLAVPETQHALANSSLIASLATLLALAGRHARRLRARPLPFRSGRQPRHHDLLLPERVLPPVVIVIPFYLVMRSSACSTPTSH